MSEQSAPGYRDHKVATSPNSGPGNPAATERELCERALAAWRLQSLTTDATAAVVCSGRAVVIVPGCVRRRLPNGRDYCMCEPLAVYRLRSDGRLRRTGTRQYILHVRDLHKTPEEQAAHQAYLKAALQAIGRGAVTA